MGNYTFLLSLHKGDHSLVLKIIKLSYSIKTISHLSLFEYTLGSASQCYSLSCERPTCHENTQKNEVQHRLERDVYVNQIDLEN